MKLKRSKKRALFKRVLTAFVCLLLCLSLAPMSAFSDENGDVATTKVTKDATVKDNLTASSKDSGKTNITGETPKQRSSLSVVEVKARKIFENAELQGGDFTFKLTSDELAIDGGTITATNDPEGNIVFRFEIPDGTPPDDYNLSITEVDTGKEGVSYDTETKPVILRINDDGTYELNGVPIFKNKYELQPLQPLQPINVQVKAKKVLEGASLQGGEFKFQLTGDINGNEISIIATNDRNGDIVFGFDLPAGTAPGDYGLYITEVDTGKEGVSYDLVPKPVILRINDDGTYVSEIPVFLNSYTQPVGGIKAKKVLEGASLQGGEFKFQLTGDINGNEISITATNDRNGDIVFGFDLPAGTAPGDYDLYITEVDTGKEGVSYDLVPKPVILRINDDGSYNQLLKREDGTYVSEIPVFLNRYTQPPTPRYDSISVNKVWKNDSAAVRPDTVKVMLLRDGKEYNSVELSDKNNWQHRWKGLDAMAKWTVKECDVPENYASSVSKKGNVFTIKNVYDKDGKNGKDDKNDRSQISMNTSSPKTGDDSNITLWAVLAVFGLAGTAGAAAFKRKKEKN